MLHNFLSLIPLFFLQQKKFYWCWQWWLFFFISIFFFRAIGKVFCTTNSFFWNIKWNRKLEQRSKWSQFPSNFFFSRMGNGQSVVTNFCFFFFEKRDLLEEEWEFCSISCSKFSFNSFSDAQFFSYSTINYLGERRGHCIPFNSKKKKKAGWKLGTWTWNIFVRNSSGTNSPKKNLD